MKLFGKVSRSEIEDVRGATETLGRVCDGYKKRLSSHQARLAGLERRIRRIETYLSSDPEDAIEEEEESEDDNPRERQLAAIRRG